MDFASIQWDSHFLYATVLKVDEVTDKKANGIFKVRYKLSRMKADNSGPEDKEVIQQVSVPVQSDGKAFVISGFPQIVKVNEKAEVPEGKEEKEREEIHEMTVKEDIREFLPTFFKSYTTATQKELAYVLANTDIKGLEGAMKFENVLSSKIYPGKTKGTYEVQTEVSMIDPHSESKMKTGYTLFCKTRWKAMDRNRLKNKIGEGHVYVQYKSFCVRNRVRRIFEMMKTQGTYALYCAFIIVILIVAAKRAWGKAITLIVGGGIVVFFINKPDALKTIGTWLGGLFGV